MSERERLTQLLTDCHDDPDLFNSAILNRSPYWSGQRRIADSVVRYVDTVAYTGNALGKDYLVGGLVPWWLFTRHDSLVIVTGPSQTLLGTVTWKEIRRAIEQCKLPLKAKFSQGAKASPQTVTLGSGWQALGYSTTSVERASGQHARELLVIVEEASGVETEVWEAIDSLKYTRLLAIGNPIRAEGQFIELIRRADKHKQDGVAPELATNAIRIPSTASPDAHLEKSPRGLADKNWLAKNYAKYGRDSLWVRSHIDAIIPIESSDSLIPVTWLDRAGATPHPPLTPFGDLNKTRWISCDLGEGVGRDSTAIFVSDDLGVLEIVAGNSLGLAEAASRIAKLAGKWHVPHNRISYDRLGVGRDLRHYLIREGIRDAIGYAGSGAAQSAREFTNLRTEGAWKLRRRLNPEWSDDPRFALTTKQPAFSIPPGAHWPLLREELEKLTYDLVGTQIRLMSKEDHCAELGRSPDRCDALIQRFALAA